MNLSQLAATSMSPRRIVGAPDVLRVKPAVQKRRAAIVQAVRESGWTSCAELTQRVRASERTIYRDMAELQADGAPIAGLAGAGYLWEGE